MIPEIRQIKMSLTLFEQVKNDNIELAKENDKLKAKILELENKLKG